MARLVNEPYIENSFATITGCEVVANIIDATAIAGALLKANHPDRIGMEV